MSSTRLLGVIVFGIAICLCLIVCAIPQIMAQKSAAADCHTEDQEQTDHSNFCCSGVGILPGQTSFSPAVHYELTLQDEAFIHKADTQNVFEIDRFHQLSIFLPTAVLRI